MSDKRYKDPGWLEEKYWHEGLKTSEMADLCGVDRRTIDRSMHAAGIEMRSRSTRLQNNYASFRTDHRGYENWRSSSRETDGQISVPIHRLLAVAEYGFDAVSGAEVHHKNGIPWDNRPENIEPLSRIEHQRAHNPATKSWLERLKIVEVYNNTEATAETVGAQYGVSAGAVYKYLRASEQAAIDFEGVRA